MNAHDPTMQKTNGGLASPAKPAGSASGAQVAASPGQQAQVNAMKADQNNQFKAAYKYSKRVRRLKVGLPFIGAFCIVLFIGLAVIGQWVSAPLGGVTIDLTSGQVVMDRPSLSGFTASNASYEIVANRALQDLDDPKKVLLEKIGATLTLKDGNVVSVDANAGRFDVDAELLILSAGVGIHMSSGYSVKMEDVRINMKEGTLTSDNPVDIKADIGDISADRLTVRENGAFILFEDRVKMTIDPNEIRTQ